MKLSFVVGIAARTRRSRSQGSSRWKRTATAMWVLEVKSTARKPTRSIVGAIARMSAVVRPVALQRLWLPSRVVVSTMSTTRLTRCWLHAEERRAELDELRVLRAHLRDRPETPAGTAFIIFITSIRPTTCASSTRVPTSTNGVAPGAGAR